MLRFLTVSMLLTCLMMTPGTNLLFAQDLVLTAPPREKSEAGVKLYKPLADHLSQLLGKRVNYVHPGNWLNYQREMRDDKYDIVFDGPHFAAWRMEHLGHNVGVRLPGNLEFMLFTHKDNVHIRTPNDLIAKKFCGITPPNLSTLSVLAAFPNPVRQPVIRGIQGGGMPAVYKAFMNGDCQAAVVRDTFYKKKLTDEQRANLKIVYQPPLLPNQSITVSKRLNTDDAQLILRSLTTGKGIHFSESIVKRFGGKQTKTFIPARTEEFAGINSLLEGVIFGW